MDLTKALEILVEDHMEEQMKDPQILPLPELVEMLGGSLCGELHEGMLPGDIAKCIMADMADLGLLERAKEYFENVEEENLTTQKTLYEVMTALGEVDWK